MNTIKLAKVILKNFEMVNLEKKHARVFFRLMEFLTYLIIIIPCSGLIGFIAYGMTQILIENGGLSEGIDLILYGVSLFSFVFSINVILNIFYFSSDTSYLLALPLKPREIIGAKFISAFINESAIQFVLILSSLVGFLVALNAGVGSYFLMIIAVITIPIIPLCLCGIICLLLMGMLRFIKNKDLVNKLSALIIGILIIGVIVLLMLSVQGDINDFTISLLDSGFMKTMNIIMPQISLLTKGIYQMNIGYIFLFILINLLYLFVFFFLANILYFKGVTGIKNGHGNQGNKKIKYQKKNILNAYFTKEVKVLFKTPGYFMNCVMINFIWPIFLVFLIYISEKKGVISLFMDKYHQRESEACNIVLIIVIALSILITALNSIASSSISREGKGWKNLKALPVDYSLVIHSKALSSLALTFVPLCIYIIIFGIYYNFGILNIIIYCLLSFICVVASSYLGVYIDSLNPKLTWDGEMNALRGNQTVFINMAICIIICALFGVLIYYVGGLWLSFGLVLVFLTVSMFICLKDGIKRINDLG